MINFIHNLINRHAAPVNIVLPRLRGKFEPMGNLAANPEPLVSPVAQSAHEFHDQEPSPRHNATRNLEEPDPPLSNRSLHKPERIDLPDEVKQDSPEREEPDDSVEAPPGILRHSGVPLDEKLPASDKVHFWRQPKDDGMENTPIKEPKTLVDFQKLPVQEFAEETKTAHPQENQDAASVRPGDLTRPTIVNRHIHNTVVQSAPFGEPPAAQVLPRNTARNSGITSNEAVTSPVIKVSIGQINVKAVFTPAATAKKTATVSRPSLSLEDYLKKRSKEKP